jgi:hypothetical protein
MKRKVKAIEFNPVNDPKRVHGYKNVRWIENASRGLRLVGFADEIARKEHSRAIEHKGWYTYDDGDPREVLRGVVYQLPSRKGQTLYVYGYADPNNDDCALLCFEQEGDKMEAAKQADRFAEIFAEDERDYHRAWDAGRRCEDLDEEIKTMRKEALAIGAEMREAKRAKLEAPTICATLRSKVLSLYRSIQKARYERTDLFNTYGRCEGFQE